MDIGESIRKQVQEAVEAALRAAPKNPGAADTHTSSSSSTSFASATNVGGSGHTVSVYVDDEVTIVDRDGKRRVIRHDEADGDEGDQASGSAGDAARDAASGAAGPSATEE